MNDPIIPPKNHRSLKALVNAQETKQPAVPRKIPALPHTNWTHRYKESGQPADYQFYDQIWVNNALAGRVTRV